MADNTNSIYTNMKGKKCPLRDNLTCQEGYCSECEIPLSNKGGVMTEILQVTPKGGAILQTLQDLSEVDIRLIGFIANYKAAM